MKGVKEHSKVQAARQRLGQLRMRLRELEGEFEQVRFGPSEPNTEELAAEVYASGSATMVQARTASEIQRELNATNLAIGRAKSDLQAAKARAESEVLDSVEREYRSEIRRVARGVRRLLEMAEGEREVRERVREAGVNPTLRPRHFHPLPEASLREWLRRAESHFDV